MNQQDDSIRSLAARRGLIAAGALMALYIIAAVVYTFVMLHPVQAPIYLPRIRVRK